VKPDVATSGTSGRPAGRCVTAEIDLDALAAGYDHRPLSPSGRRHATLAVRDLAPQQRLLDVGGGPGAHAGVWAEMGHRPVVLDPGRSMIDTASQRTGVVAVRAMAQHMPLRTNTFQLAYFHLSIHYGDWQAALDEAVRVVAPGGRVWIWTLGPDHHEASMLARWFPSVAELDRVRFPDPNALAAYLGRHGSVEIGREADTVNRPAGEWRDAVAAGFVSTLQLVSPAELAAGLDAFAQMYPDPSQTIEYEMYWTRIVVVL
jgi:SAM-dependent methyltransferase